MWEAFGPSSKHGSVLPSSLVIQCVLLISHYKFLWLALRDLCGCCNILSRVLGRLVMKAPGSSTPPITDGIWQKNTPRLSAFSLGHIWDIFVPAGLNPTVSNSYLFINLPSSGFLHVLPLQPHSPITAFCGHFPQINFLHSSPDVRVCFWGDRTEDIYHIFRKLDYWSHLNYFIRCFFLSFSFLCQPYSISLFSHEFQGHVASSYKVKFFGKMYKEYHEQRIMYKIRK